MHIINMSSLYLKPAKVVLSFAADLAKYLEEEHDGVVLTQSPYLRNVLLAYKRDLTQHGMQEHLDFIDDIVVCPVSFEFIKNAVYLNEQNNVHAAGLSPRTYDFIALFNDLPYQQLPTLQLRFNEFHDKLKDSLQYHPDEAIEAWFEGHHPTRLPPSPAANEGAGENTVNHFYSLTAFYIFIMTLAFISYDMLLRKSEVNARNSIYYDDNMGSDLDDYHAVLNERQSHFAHNAQVLVFGAFSSFLLYHGDLHGRLERGVTSVKDTIRLSLDGNLGPIRFHSPIELGMYPWHH